MRNTLALFAAALILLGTTGCQRHSRSDRYYLIAANIKVPYWTTAAAGFRQAADSYGVTAAVDGPAGEDAAVEADAFRRAMNARPAGILVSVADQTRMQPLINNAVRSGIPVITLDSDAPGSARLYFIGTNNYQAGQLGGQRLVRELHGKGNVVFFTFPMQPNLAERLMGYQDAFNASNGVKTVDVVNVEQGSNVTFDKVREMLGRTGPNKVDAFVSLESTSAKNVADALQRQHVTDRTVMGMDVSEDTLNLIANGGVVATVAQKPYTMGYIGLKALVHVHEDDMRDVGERGSVRGRFPGFVDTGTAVVDKTNLSAWQGK